MDVRLPSPHTVPVRLSKKSEYAVRALIEIARHDGGGWRQISQIAESTGIPEKYLEQILLTLKKGSLLQSRRGAVGGYGFLRRPDEITILEVIELLDGGEQPIEPVTDVGGIVFHTLATKAMEAGRKVWASITIADAAAQARRIEASSVGALEYQI